MADRAQQLLPYFISAHPRGSRDDERPHVRIELGRAATIILDLRQARAIGGEILRAAAALQQAESPETGKDSE